MSDEFRLRAYSAELALDKAGKRIKELEVVVDASDMEICKLYDENVRLREAIKTHKDSFIGDEGDICIEDDRLWAALEVK